MLKNTIHFCLLALSMACALCTWAQPSDFSAEFNRPDAQEQERLRAVLAEPVSPDASLQKMRELIWAKDVAARKLGDDEQLEAVLREAVRLLPDPVFKNNLSRRLVGKGQFEEGNELLSQAIASTSNVADRIFWSMNQACDMVNQNKNSEARPAISAVINQIKAAQSTAGATSVQQTLLRASALVNQCLSILEQRYGRNDKAIEAAEISEKSARQALSLLASDTSPANKLFIEITVAHSIARKLQAYRAAGRLHDAEMTLTQGIRYSREVQLPPEYLAGIYATAAGLRFSQREFQQSEVLWRHSDATLETLRRAAMDKARTNSSQGLITALSGQKNWDAALKELDRLDELAGDDPKLKQQVRYIYERAVVYLAKHRFKEAAMLFERHVSNLRKIYDEHHFFVAQAKGLQGAALWRSGTADNKALALPLLKEAVRDFMAPANADYLENIGYRKERREEVFAAYLEAMALTPGEDVTQAMGPADWVRGSAVQEALADAAARASANTPALANIVRQEQDAKNEVIGLRRYLSGEAGSASSPLPVIAAQMRERIALLENDRQKLQTQIKAQFPEYAKLVHPSAPSVGEVAKQLERHQALVMLLPTSDAIYVWAVAADRPAGFVRAPLKEAQLASLVDRLRAQFDFAKGSGTQFDSAAAYALYDQLLAPLHAVWGGKSQLIVAAGGSLSQLPFAVLQTQPQGGFGAQAPWLIRQTAIAQVPSLSAWLSIKALAKNPSASAPLMAWGDPQFALNTPATTPSHTSSARALGVTRAALTLDLSQLESNATATSALQYADIPPLPDTRDELLEIAQVLKANLQTDVLLGQQATRDSVLQASRKGALASKRVIAFATHGLMAGDLPNLTQPALALAATGTESSQPLSALLTLEDVLTLKLNADWVVLSACNTAAADGKGEETLSGLARGFFYAGSRSLLVTHWAVESESAKLLTTQTFSHYTANPSAPKAESLRQAMLSVMAMPQYQHPIFWAPYALVGDGGR